MENLAPTILAEDKQKLKSVAIQRDSRSPPLLDGALKSSKQAGFGASLAAAATVTLACHAGLLVYKYSGENG